MAEINITKKDKTLIIKGAREHNLKNVDLEIPKNKLIVFTGVSGSGKSSLVFDTIYAEGTTQICRKSFRLCKAVS